MDPSVNEFSFQQFSATSTPMPTSLYQKKRPLLNEQNLQTSLTFASPASKKPSSNLEGSSNETMPDLFFYDKTNSGLFSFEEDAKDGQENLQKNILSSVEEANSAESGSTVEGSSSQIYVKNAQRHRPKRIISSEIEESILSDSAKENEAPQNIESSSVNIEEIEEESGNDSQNETNLSVTTDKRADEHIETVDDSLSDGDDKAEESVLIEEDEESIENDGAILNKIDERQNHQLPRAPQPYNISRKPIMISAPNILTEQTRPAIYQTMHVQPGRLFGGKMTDARFEKITGISNDIINAMHSSLSTLPENVPTESPEGLRVDLMPHQKTGLTWLVWREQQMPPSGILADDMGLGKTLAMISFILHYKNARKENPDEMLRTDKQLRRRYIDGAFLIPANTTLIVAPASLIFQWDKEVRDRVKGDLKVHIFHGPKHKRDIAVERLIKYDMVITTYDTLVSELKNQRVNLIGADDSDEFPKAPSSVLAKIAWERVILDEAHEIRNKNSLKFHCCCSLEAVHRWCLTGTPIHNKLWDLYSLIHFLRVSPFSEEKVWKEFIMSSSATSAQRLNVIVKNVLLRRTKNQICAETNRPIVDLQPKNYELVTLDLQKPEQHCYTIMFEASKQKVRELLQEGALGGYGGLRRVKPGAKIKNPFVGGGARMAVDDHFKAYSSILTLLLRLRQACVHLSLTKNAIDIDAFKQDDDEADGSTENLVAKVLEISMAQMTLDEDELNGNGGITGNDQIEQLFKKEHKSTKINALLSRLIGVVESGDKCVVVSQWTSMLAIVEFHLRQLSISYTSITGEVRTDERQPRVDSFNRAGVGPKVMLLSLTAGGVGLNLIGANHLFLVDLHWNPALELQASDRIHRLGQKKNVFVHKFVCASTIEQRVLQLQEKKTTMATSVLEGAAKRVGKLSKDDVMYLFELEKRPSNPQKAGPSQKPPMSSQM
uniref:Transcription termination factor 2 n=1 Tax=Globodera rostochiensis TaxID=31243 RepID=A0A914HDF7_GLORO